MATAAPVNCERAVAAAQGGNMSMAKGHEGGVEFSQHCKVFDHHMKVCCIRRD